MSLLQSKGFKSKGKARSFDCNRSVEHRRLKINHLIESNNEDDVH